MTASVGFAEFFRGVHGHRPFPWQEDLAERIVSSGRLPDVLDIPTGLGKTAVIDVAVWVAARTGCQPGSPGRRRTFFVIDRRIVVDEAFEHAQRLADALSSPRNEACRDVAAALRALSGAPACAPPLLTERMRGGASWDWRWSDRPDRPGVVVGTVDQLGSRFLFRAYGLSGELAPIDAALVGLDSLVIIDEAHLSTPLIRTIDAAARHEAASDRDRTLPPASVLPMSATLASAGAHVVSISDADRADAVASRRLNARKSLHLVRVGGSASGRVDRVAPLMAELAIRELEGEEVQAVGVICNTVARAREVFDAVRSRSVKRALDPWHVQLLTGRVRPWDREQIRKQVWPVAGVDRNRADAPATIVVTTQTVEVGANLDFDGLVTETASWDALVQRLGRLNRFGQLEEARAILVHDGVESSLYGDARETTWSWLTELAPTAEADRVAPDLLDGPDAGPAALAELTSGVDLSAMRLLPADSPTLLPTHLEVWARTSPRPATDVPIAPFLHGYDSGQPEVHLVWRSDLDAAVVGEWGSLVSALPPTGDERLTVPLRAFRRWIRSGGVRGAADMGDAIALDRDTGDSDGEEFNDGARETVALRWSAEGEAEDLLLPRDVGRVQPDQVIVLPSSIGGCDRFGWAPASTAPVPDIGDLCGPTPVLRLSPLPTLRQTLSILDVTLTEAGSASISTGIEQALEDEDPMVLARAGLDLWKMLPTRARAALLRLDPGDGADAEAKEPGLTGVLLDRDRTRAGLVRLTFRGTRSRAVDARRSSDSAADPAGSSYSSAPVTLEVHQAAVAARARTIAENLGLPAAQTESVVAAAAWHDVGKLDRRFQTMLTGGDDLAADVALASGDPLAKSGLDPADRSVWRRAHRASGLPPGFRHEVGSAAAVAVAVASRDDVDRDLVLHLVASHHGRSRPLFPPVDDDSPQWTLDWSGVSASHDPSRSIDWAAPARFGTLNARYGHWGLAMLETIVRLADIGCSAEGS